MPASIHDYKTQLNKLAVPRGALAKCFFKMNDETGVQRTYNMLNIKDFQAEFEPKIEDLPLLGRVNPAKRIFGWEGTFSGTMYYNQSVIRKLLYKFKRDYVFDDFEIVVINHDPASEAEIGKQTCSLSGCQISGKLILAKIAIEDKWLDEPIEGTFDDFEFAEAFKNYTNMFVGVDVA